MGKSLLERAGESEMGNYLLELNDAQMYEHNLNSHSQTKRLITMCILLSCGSTHMFFYSSCTCLQRSKQWLLLNLSLLWIVFWVFCCCCYCCYCYFPQNTSVYISLMKIWSAVLGLQGIFFFLCSYTENAFFNNVFVCKKIFISSF